MKLATTSLCVVGVALLFGQSDARSAEPSLPAVEIDFGSTQAADWSGRRFRDIIPSGDINRVLRVKGGTFGNETAEQVQQRYNSLITHLLESNEPASDYRGFPDEAVTDQLLIITKAGVVFLFEVRNYRGMKVPAVTLRGPGHGARFAVKGNISEQFAQGPIFAAVLPAQKDARNAKPLTTDPAHEQRLKLEKELLSLLELEFSTLPHDVATAMAEAMNGAGLGGLIGPELTGIYIAQQKQRLEGLSNREVEAMLKVATARQEARNRQLEQRLARLANELHQLAADARGTDVEKAAKQAFDATGYVDVDGRVTAPSDVPMFGIWR